MKKIFVLMLTVSLLFSMGCGGKKEGKQLEDLNIGDLVEKGAQISKDISNSEKKLEQRKKRGDTIATDWQKLNELIPDIPGYTRSKPDGMKMTFDNTSYSNVSMNFSNNSSSIDVNLFDYNCAVSLLAGVSAWKSSGLSIETSEGYQKVTKFNDVADSWIFEEYNSQDKRATVTLSLNDRYYLQVAANDQPNTDFVKKIAANIANNGKSLFSR